MVDVVVCLLPILCNKWSAITIDVCGGNLSIVTIPVFFFTLLVEDVPKSSQVDAYSVSFTALASNRISKRGNLVEGHPTSGSTLPDS